jgi:uncharacterized protein (DUF305 family)
MLPLRLLPLALLASGLTACERVDDAPDAGADSSAADHAAMDHGAMDHGMRSNSAYSDVRFLDHMTAHHQMAVDMARAVGDRGASPDVRAMAQAVIRDQTAEIDSMRAWRARWFPDEPAADSISAHGMAMMGMAMDMDALTAASGAELDRQFLAGMIPHHAGAIIMAAHAQMSSGRPEIRDFARSLISAQAREIGRMEATLSAMGTAAPADPDTTSL